MEIKLILATYFRIKIYVMSPQLPGNMTSEEQPKLVIILREEYNGTKE